MKRILVITTLLAVAGIAFAAGNKETKYTLGATNNAPTSSTVGIPLNDQDGQCLKSLSVTLMDYSDGGSGDENFPWLADGLAWIENDTMAYPDGGGKWTRAPQFDLSFDAGTSAGAPTSGTNFPGITQVIPVLTANGPLPCLASGPRGGRIYYQTKNLLGHDAGAAFPHNILMQGRY